MSGAELVCNCLTVSSWEVAKFKGHYSTRYSNVPVEGQ